MKLYISHSEVTRLFDCTIILSVEQYIFFLFIIIVILAVGPEWHKAGTRHTEKETAGSAEALHSESHCTVCINLLDRSNFSGILEKSTVSKQETFC